MNSQSIGVESDRTLTLAAYVLHLVGSIAAVPSIIGLILNYLRRHQGDYVQDSHHSWMIRSFWWALVWLVVGFITSVIFIGWIVCFLAWAWYVYRHIRGLVALVNGEPLPR